MQDLDNQKRKMPMLWWYKGTTLPYITELILKIPARHPKDIFRQHGIGMTAFKHLYALTQAAFLCKKNKLW